MRALQDVVITMRCNLTRQACGHEHRFAFVVIDGLSLKEDQLISALSPALGTVPLFGGSTGDRTRFEQPWLALDGEIHRDAAVLTIVRTACPVRVFSLDHLMPTDQRMIVTEADPSQRIVGQLNAEPAARESARVLGKDPEQLSPFTFAAHPLVVRGAPSRSGDPARDGRKAESTHLASVPSMAARAASSASSKTRERVRKRRSRPLSSENIPPRPGTTSRISWVCCQASNCGPLM